MDRRLCIGFCLGVAFAIAGVVMVSGRAQGQDKVEYVGAAACMCHADPVQSTWQESKHAKAFELLKMSGQEKNPQCIPCHTTGFGSGGFGEAASDVNLEGVQCEECHGPAGEHVATMDKTKVNRTPSAIVCARCHMDASIHARP